MTHEHYCATDRVYSEVFLSEKITLFSFHYMLILLITFVKSDVSVKREQELYES